MDDLGTLTCPQITRTTLKIRISKYEIRNNIEVLMFKIQNIIRCWVLVLLNFPEGTLFNKADLWVLDEIRMFYRLRS